MFRSNFIIKTINRIYGIESSVRIILINLYYKDTKKMQE